MSSAGDGQAKPSPLDVCGSRSCRRRLRALSEPVTITKNGHDRLVILSADEYGRLKRRDRRVVRAGELTEEEIALIAKAEVPAEYAHLDEELKDWRP
jgi:PHD/YefM family antitoxin component YafN of YafNO toxin-antitoxin module